jgi:hypothetical protein
MTNNIPELLEDRENISIFKKIWEKTPGLPPIGFLPTVHRKD